MGKAESTWINLDQAGSSSPVHLLRCVAGLLVVAKDEQSLARLSQQFKDRSVQRTYKSITLGCPSPATGQVATNIGRDARDRKKMGAYALDSSRYLCLSLRSRI